MKKIAILYIATGPYIVFWKEFYKTFEKNFLPDIEKHYYVFSDAIDIEYSDCERVHIKKYNAEPWPLPTLMKYHLFLSYETELLEYDYCYQSNANIICNEIVEKKDFLPREELGERLIFTLHPDSILRKKYQFSYERDHRSTAYIPYNCGKRYVYGAMNGGCTKEFLDFMKETEKNIEEDLKRRLIAVWHDESHINRCIIGKDNIRYLSVSYCFPRGYNVPGRAIITGVPKEKFFNVNEFKGYYEQPSGIVEMVKRIYRKTIKSRWYLFILMARDYFLRKKI